MKSLKDKEIELMCYYLQLEFPKIKGKVRTSDNRRSRKFRPVVMIPTNYTNKPTKMLPYSDTEEMKILFGILKNILDKIFGFDEDHINVAIMSHFNLL